MQSSFTKQEKILWFVSIAVIFLAFALFDRSNYLTLTASLIGVTSLIYNAKGNPFGQLLMIVFSLLYGVISYSFQWRNDHISWHDHADGSFCAGFVAQKSVYKETRLKWL